MSVFPKPPSFKKDNARQKALSIKLRHSLVWRQYYTNFDADLSLTCTREFKQYLKYFVNVGDNVKTLVAKGNIPQGTIGKVISITFNSSIKVEINGNKEIVEYENGDVSQI